MGCVHGKCGSRGDSQHEVKPRGPQSKLILTQGSLESVPVPSHNFSLEYSVLTQRGYYPDSPDKENQDSFCIKTQLQGNPNVHFFGVFDGHGQFGTQCSTFVQQRLVEILANDLTLLDDPVRAYNSAFVVVNNELHNSEIDDTMSGTTAITVLVIGDKIYVANVGDSRAVIAVKEGNKIEAQDLSYDQTPFRKDEYERVKVCGARVLSVDQLEGLKDPSIQTWGDEESQGGDPPRLWVQNGMYPGTAFTRSVGDSTAEKIGVVSEPEVSTLQLMPNHLFFVVASDGVFEVISSQAVVDMVSKYADPRDACSAIAGDSYKLWLEHESRADDITIIIVQIKDFPISGDGATDRTTGVNFRPSVQKNGRKPSDMSTASGSDYFRDESAVEVVAQGKKGTQRMKGKLAVEKDGGFEALKSDVMAVKHRGSSFEIEVETTSDVLGDIEYQSEIVPAAVTKSVLDTDQVPASSIETVIEDEMMRPQQSPLDEYEIQRIHEREGELNLHVKGSVGENRRMLPIHEIVPSQPEVESQMNVKQSVGPVETFKAGPSNTTAVEPATASPFRKKDEIPLVIELTEGDRTLLSSGLDVKTSTGRTVLKILGYMNDVTTGKVGVHGIGGIGKTSVLEALINHVETKCIFDLIMFVSVSRYWSIRKIQNEVLRQLSLSREDSETDTQVAERLFQVLSGRKFLLLLDDVWEQIHLETVGIPDPCSVKGSKILMASKKLNVFSDMDVSRVIEVETMSREEAWELFSKQVGGIINSPDIQPFARAIANGCGGLPLLIIVTGKALTGEDNVTVWEHASRKFSLPGTTGTYQTEDVIQLLKFSFDRLRDYDMKSCFLHCSLFSKDREVTIFELIEYCIQEGVIDASGGYVHKRGLDIVDDLKLASLLQDTKDDNSIKMHDLIRDLALGILSSVAEGSQYLLRTGSLKEPSNPASSLPPPENSRLNIPEGHQFLLRAGAGLTEPPSEEEWRQAKMIFLMDNDLCTLPERPTCQELLILFLQRNYRLRMIPPSFFDFMTSLKVLNLSKTRVKSLPVTLFKLVDLQVLILRDCERLVMLPSEVRHLKHLEVLDLQGTEITELPDEIGQLTSLRHLKVSFYGSIDYGEYVKLPRELISSGILSSLKALETLSIVVYPGDQRWNKDVKYVVTDISNLTNLSSLCFHFPEVELLEPFLQTSEAWNSRRLTEFKFVIGHDVKSITSRVPNFVECDYYRQGQCLRFVNGEKISDAVRKVLARSTAFYLDHHLTIYSLSDFGVSNINELKLCIISECPKMETVVDCKELTMTVFSNLENLRIYYLWNLTRIWEGTVPKGSFSGLKILSLCACPKLKNVFSSSMIDFVSNLEELVVEDCPAIEEIILEGENEIIPSDSILLPSLNKLTLHDLPELVNIWKSAWPSLEHISFYNCPKLKRIGWDSKLKRTIREIEAEKSWWDELEWEDTDLRLVLQDHLATICEDDL